MSRKRFGQHWLADSDAAEAIADLVRLQEGELLLEVGPGRGALTRPLLRRFQRLTAVEIDRDLVAHLRREIADPGFELLEADILRLDLRGLVAERDHQQLHIVGNLPYNITAPFLFRLRQFADITRHVVVTLQREVAERLVSPPGGRQYGRISVLFAQCAVVEIRQRLSPHSFRPPPRVESAVLEISFQPERVPVVDESTFSRVVRVAFAQRRKMLRNALASLDTGSQSLEEVAERAGIALTCRAEELSVEDYARLADIVSTGTGQSE